MFLKELVLRLNRTLWGQFLREICPFEKKDPKIGANIGAISGILLSQHLHHPAQIHYEAVNSSPAIRVLALIFY
jgi:hypothetical protein